MLKTRNGLDDILNECARLMAQKSYAGTSMRDLARETKRSLAGLYHYFKNKEELLFLINHNGFSFLRESARTIHAREAGPEETLSRFIANHIRYAVTHLDEMKIMLMGTRLFDRRRAKLINGLKYDYACVGRQVVGEYIQSLAHKRGPAGKDELSRKTFLLFGMLNWIPTWYSARDYGTPERLAGDIFSTFTQGVGIPAGRKRKSKSLEKKPVG